MDLTTTSVMELLMGDGFVIYVFMVSEQGKSFAAYMFDLYYHVCL